MPKTQNPLQRRSSSTLSSLKRTKPASRTSALPRLDDVGTIASLPPAGVRQDVVNLIQYIKEHSFDDLPERAGMNSVQISTTLRFRATVPPIVTLAHLYALSSSPTATERELARLTAQGVLRKISIPGRGKGGTAIGDGIVLVEDWVAAVRNASLSEGATTKYVSLLKSQPLKQTTNVQTLSDAEVRELVTAGFFTSPAALTASLSDLFAMPTASLLNISSAGSSAPTGTIAAVGGAGAVHESGGSGSVLATAASRSSNVAGRTREMTFSLPSTGVYLKLLASARAHLLFLLKQLSPKWKESTIDLLKEKWNGGIGMMEIGEQKRARNESNGLLAGKTKRWREFMGLRFEYVLAEALGSGSVELFDTGSVGPAVRIR